MFRPAMAGRPASGWIGAIERVRLPVLSPASLRAFGLGAAGAAALLGLAIAVVLLTVRATHAERIFPDVTVADVPVGGMPIHQAAVALADRAEAIESSPITFIHEDRIVDRDAARRRRVDRRERGARARGRVWPRGLGVPQIAVRGRAGAVRRAARDADLTRLSAARSLVRRDRPRSGNSAAKRLGGDPGNQRRHPAGGRRRCRGSRSGPGRSRIAAPESDADRGRAPVATKIATIRAADLEPARELLLRAMSQPDSGHATRAVSGPCRRPISRSSCDKTSSLDENGAPAIQLGLDREKLAAWLDERLGAAIETEPVDAEVGWNGERLISVEPSVDGVRLDAAKLAERVEGSFFGSGGTVEAPVTHVKPTIDSANLDKLGITTFLGSGQSNYSGSSDGRATNVAVGASLLNGTLIPPWGEFSFNESIGWIDEDKGFRRSPGHRRRKDRARTSAAASARFRRPSSGPPISPGCRSPSGGRTASASVSTSTTVGSRVSMRRSCSRPRIQPPGPISSLRIRQATGCWSSRGPTASTWS